MTSLNHILFLKADLLTLAHKEVFLTLFIYRVVRANVVIQTNHAGFLQIPFVIKNCNITFLAFVFPAFPL